MTRFFVRLPVSEAVKAVQAAGTQLGYTARQLSPQQVRYQQKPRMQYLPVFQLVFNSPHSKRDLSFVVSVYKMYDVSLEKVLVDLRR